MRLPARSDFDSPIRAVLESLLKLNSKIHFLICSKPHNFKGFLRTRNTRLNRFTRRIRATSTCFQSHDSYYEFHTNLTVMGTKLGISRETNKKQATNWNRIKCFSRSSHTETGIAERLSYAELFYAERSVRSTSLTASSGLDQAGGALWVAQEKCSFGSSGERECFKPNDTIKISKTPVSQMIRAFDNENWTKFSLPEFTKLSCLFSQLSCRHLLNWQVSAQHARAFCDKNRECLPKEITGR